MNTRYIFSLATLASVATLTACIDEIEPQDSTVTIEQINNSGNATVLADAISSSLAGKFVYSEDDQYPFDFGYPSLMVMRDVMGQDDATRATWYSYWYGVVDLRPNSVIAQFPWTLYYTWIKNCNAIIAGAANATSDDDRRNVGRAYATRAAMYSDLAQMYGKTTYALNKECITVPIVTENTTTDAATNNPNATNEQIWKFILDDLDNAEKYLTAELDDPTDVYHVGLNAIYGLRARACLVMQNWTDAVHYARLAQEGHPLMDEAQWTDPNNGFNTPTPSWIWAVRFATDDPCILLNDADSSWGSQMCIEIDPMSSGCGYAANYGQPHCIDRHLFESIPTTDFRRKVFVDFAVNSLASRDEVLNFLSAYSAHPSWLLRCGTSSLNTNGGGLEVKFRTIGGEGGRANQLLGFAVSVPLMRAEEMKLIEIEALGMQNESEGIEALTAFAQTRDAAYVYGSHNEAYGSQSIATSFQNEVWWQRRVELWGEGFSTLDIKRLSKGIIRSYEGSNHPDGYQWNTSATPDWMTLVIPQSEINYNTACQQTVSPAPLVGNSAPVVAF